MTNLCNDDLGWGPLVSATPPYLFTPCFGEMIVYLVPQFVALLFFTSSSIALWWTQPRQLISDSSNWDARLLTGRIVFSALAALSFATFWVVCLLFDEPRPNYVFFELAIGTAAHLAAVARQRSVFFTQYAGDGGLLVYWLSNIVIDGVRLRGLVVIKYNDQPVDWDVAVLACHAAFVVIAFALELVNKDYASWSVWLGDKDSKEKLCPEQHANLFSVISFWWLNSVIRQGYIRPLTESDLWKTPLVLQPRIAYKKFSTYWNKQLEFAEGERSLVGAIMRSQSAEIFITGILALIGSLLGFVQPLLLQELIDFVTDASEDPSEEVYIEIGIWIAIAMLVSALAQTIFLNQYFHGIIRLSLQIRSAIISLLYRKSLLLTNKARQQSSVGETVTLMSIDAQKMQDMVEHAHEIWLSPLQIALALALLYVVLGPAAFAGLGVMFLLIPINGLIMWRIFQLQTDHMQAKDRRIKLMDEVLGGIKIIKLYAWEKSFIQRIQEVRSSELSILRKSVMLFSIVYFTFIATGIWVALVCFTVYTLSGNVLTADKAFVSLSLLNILQMPMIQLPLTISQMIEARVSIRRIVQFLQAEELDQSTIARSHPILDNNKYDSDEDQDEQPSQPATKNGYMPVSINDDYKPETTLSDKTDLGSSAISVNGTFDWDVPETSNDQQSKTDVDAKRRDGVVLKDIQLEVKHGQLVAVVGAVGAGKSSLLAAVLGEMRKRSGSVKLNGTVAYSPQQPWIRNATFADNIRFGRESDEDRYRNIINACALVPDIELLPAGDQTEIGEKGINLSGGQKQRVSLARCLFADADIYLFDDPLSAVDAHVGRHLFDQVIGPSGLLRLKARLFVTHGVNFLPQCDYILVMRDGEIVERGTFDELMSSSSSFKRLLTEFSAVTNPAVNESQVETVQDELNNIYDAKDKAKDKTDESKDKKDILIQEEEPEVGAVKGSIYLLYMQSFRFDSLMILIMLFIVGLTTEIGTSLWLSYWSSQESNDQIGLYIGVYAALGTTGAAFIAVQVIYGLTNCGYRAAIRLHNELLQSVFHAPMSFFDTTPTGRIINRFAKDQSTVDSVLPESFIYYIRQVFSVLGIIIVISLSTPVFIAVIAPLGLVYYFIQTDFIHTSRQLKRMDSVTRSPLFAHFQETLQGVVTIRAFGHQQQFILENEQKLDSNQRPGYAMVAANRWVATRLEFIGSLAVFFAALFAVLGYKTIDPALVGLSVSYALQVTGELSWLVRCAAELESNIVAVERIHEYTSNIDREAPDSMPDNVPKSNWPPEGQVTFDDYNTRYRAGLDLVLRNVSFHVRPHEKIGVCGRTGAGKSSLTQALFRIIEPVKGHIDIDNCNTSSIGLHDLRSKLTIIPQDPVLFSGSLRRNLDPFDEYTDEQIWTVLEHANLKQTVEKLSDRLATQILLGGENFSVGQRQLLCLSRALLRKSAILVMDEATAAVDLETDNIVQATIRREFRDCTIFTIAHRLNTIMDSDRILVLDKGEIKEFDAPSALLANPSSAFYGLAKEAALI